MQRTWKRDQKFLQNSDQKTYNEEIFQEDVEIDGRKVLKWI
jgi:hypothetical protein